MDSDLKKRLNDIEEWLQKEFASIRTGQASPAILDGVSVESYGSVVPLNQVSNIGSEDARTLRVTPWDTSQVPAIEKALQEADLGVSVSADSAGVRVTFPELTAERRVQLLKLAKGKLEDARISVRSIRDDVMKDIDVQQKNGDISEDEKFSQKERIQKQIDATNQTLDSLCDQKEKELQQ